MLTTAGLFPHRMRVFRDDPTVRDRFGQRIMEVINTESGLSAPGSGMSTTNADIRCRASTPTGGQRFDERSQLVFVTFYNVFTDPNADVRGDDRVQIYEPIHNGVIVPDGIITLITPVYAIETVHHLEIKVQLIAAPGPPTGTSPTGGSSG